MSLANMFNNFRTNFYKKYSKDLGGMLLVTGTLGWVFSSAGQLLGIAQNDKISKEKKKFLYPQEIADAAINIFFFFTTTKFAKEFGKKLVSSGRLITKTIETECAKRSIEILKDGKLVKGLNIGKYISDIESKNNAVVEFAKSGKIKIDAEKITELEKDIVDIKKFKDEVYIPFESGMEVAGSVIGSVVASNIITPWLRNPIAAMKQKFDIAMEQQEVQHQAELQKSKVPAQNKVALNTYKPALTPTSGSMKI